jgi:tryptophan synthase beta chain
MRTVATPIQSPQSGRRRRPNVVVEIAARRGADLRAELAGRSLRSLERAAAAAPPPRSFVDRLARPGLHLIAEVKRASPSAGLIAPEADPIDRARSYVAAGAAAISVLCEPHWFGGSVDDLRRVRAAVAAPVLAKEFVVDRRQLPLLRAAGADAVLLLAVLHGRRRLGELVRVALDLGLEPLVEVHDEAELERALATEARCIGLNNRDLRSLAVDVERAARLRPLVPEDRLVVAESGYGDATVVPGLLALGIDAVLVGEALMRSPDPAALAGAFVAAGRPPDDPANRDRRSLVKICGVTDADGILAAVRAGADVVGLNLVRGTPRALELDEAAALARLARSAGGGVNGGVSGGGHGGGGPAIAVVVADPSPDALARIVAAVDPDLVQCSGDESPELVAALTAVGRPIWKAVRAPTDSLDPDAAAAAVLAEARAHLAGGAARIVLDASVRGLAGGTGRPVAEAVAARVAREIPIVLAGGLVPATVGPALRRIPAVGVDVASGVEAARRGGLGERPRKDPLRVAIFVKRARAARDDRPHLAARPTPIEPTLLEADAAGRWGPDGAFGGRYVPETLVAALAALEAAYAAVRHEPRFWAELRRLLADYAGRPTPLYRADRLAAAVLARARHLAGGDGDGRAAMAEGGGSDGLPRRLRLYLKREDLAHTGAHKINNALGQVLLARRLGKTRIIAETGAGQHGVATATACALLGLPCIVYMGAADVERQAPNVLRMRALGAEVRPVTAGSATLKDAINEAIRDWVTNVATTHYVLGSAMGPHPYPTIVRDFQRVIGDEAAAQLAAVEGRLPDLAVACVGGGSNAIGLLARFLAEPTVRLVVAEAAGEGLDTPRHAAAIRGGRPGVLHGARSLVLQDDDGQILEAHSASAGLDYPGVGPQLAALAAAGRVAVEAATDREAIAAMRAVTRAEGILPALETAHAVAILPGLLARTAARAAGARPWPAETVVLVGFSGRGDKDLAALERFADVPAWPEVG